MKIRTSFVTNSSGSSFTEITIENPVLVAILKKYNNKLLSNNKIKKINMDIDNDAIKLKNYDLYRSYLFWNGFNDVKDDSIGNSIINSYLKELEIDINQKDKELIELFDEIKRELNEKRELINKSFKRVTYHNDYSGDLGGCESSEEDKICNFDNICPKCNKPLIIRNYSLNSDYTDENGKYHFFDSCIIANYKTIYCSNSNCNYKKEIINEEYIDDRENDKRIYNDKKNEHNNNDQLNIFDFADKLHTDNSDYDEDDLPF